MTPAEIKSRYRLRDEIASRGIEINRNGFCRCPFHQGDNTASFRLYDEQNTWHCYGCGEGGDIIDFVMKIDRLSFRDACKAISGEELTKEQRWNIDRAKLKREMERIKAEKLRKQTNALATNISEYWNAMKDAEPASEEWGKLYNQWQLANYKYSVMTGEELAELWR